MTVDAQVDEILARTRRIETQLIRTSTALGIDTRTQKPEWHDHGCIMVGSPAVAVKDLLSVVPTDWNPEREISVFLNDHSLLCKFTPGRKANHQGAAR